MDGYSVLIETRAPTGVLGPRPDSHEYYLFADRLEKHHGVISGGEQSWSVQLTVDAEDFAAATRSAHRIVWEAVDETGVPDWPTVRFNVVREDVFDEEIAQPQFPPAVSGPEAAKSWA